MSKVNKFGTFGGVFTPSILTILGVIMYLRLPMIVGEAGLIGAIGIIIIAHIISVTTGLSVSSIATDRKVEAGGTYYMISRSLGLPIGGTLGLALFVGLSFSVSLYLIGFAESFLNYWELELTINNIRIAGTIILILVTTITFISTSLAIKTQYFIMAAIILSLISIFAGNHEFGPQAASSVEVLKSPSGALPFMVLFGIFFPAVTGFEAGVSMSGDLADPKKSIPTGSIMAIVVGLVVYLLLAVFFSKTVDADILAHDPQVLLKISWIPQLVVAGIWGATLSSAFGSILGAPRILQATAVDRITPRFFAKGVGASNEPRNALILTFLIAEAGILVGELDVIARIVSIFFITTYGFLNLSCAFETWTSADFRPSFKTPVLVSILGSASCFIVMIQLDFIATIGASVILGGLFLYLKRKELTLQSGDAWAGVTSTLVKNALQSLSGSKQNTRNWRPNILMFNGSDNARPFMLQLGNAISGKLGLLSSFELTITKDHVASKLQLTPSAIESDTSFHYTYVCRNVYTGIEEIARLYGFSGVEPNTILMGWSSKIENKEQFTTLIRNLERYNFNSLFLHHQSAARKITKPVIDFWWSGWGRNLSFAVNIVKHLTRSDPWTASTIRLLLIVNEQEDTDRIYHQIKKILDAYRTPITIKIIDNHVTRQNKQDLIASESFETDLTIIGIPDNSYDDMDATYKFVTGICTRLRTVLFINASDTFDEITVLSKNEQSDIRSRGEWVLPELVESSFTEINTDIQKIDEQGQWLVDELHKKVFVPCLQTETELYSKVTTLASTIGSTLQKLTNDDQHYQRKSGIERAKKYWNSQIARAIEVKAEASLKEQETYIEEGLTWYLEQLDVDRNRFPKYKTVAYPKELFKVHKNDTADLRWYKIRNRITHPFSRQSITLEINYRKAASFYFCDSRYYFLATLLADLNKQLSATRDTFRQLLTWADESFLKLAESKEAQLKNEDIQAFSSQLKIKSESLLSQIHETQLLFKGRFQVEYRKNTNFFRSQLERIDFNRQLKKRKRVSSSYTAKKEFITDFPAAWNEQSRLEFNTLRTQVLLNNYFGFVQRELKEYKTRLRQYVNQQQRPVGTLIELLSGISDNTNESKALQLPEVDFDYEFPIDALRETSERLLTQSRNLPEEVEVTNSEHEEYLLAIRAMVAHLTETTLTGPINDKFEDLLYKIRRSYLIINDQASLAAFTLFNTKGSEDVSEQLDDVKVCIASIQREETILNKTIDMIFETIDAHAKDLKGSLKLHQLISMAGNFSKLVRKRRKRQIQSRLSEAVGEFRDKVNEVFVSALYSQAKGVLLARKFATTFDSLSVNERIMKAVARVTPIAGIVQKLPHFYVSLFSGRSSIGDNFWVDRPLEEKQLKSAFNRYLIQRQGMILVLGERNSGKTALCKRFGDELQDYTPYHVFAPEDGSVHLSDFETALRKSTKYEGDSSQLFNLLPHNSLIIIHDLEMWWERSEPEGLTVIHHIKKLIEEYSSRCLFMINMNPFAYAVINTASPIDTHCAGVVRCMPFNSHELKQLVMTRHQSSGLQIDLGSGVSETIGEVKLARIFNRLFTYAQGNPGVAMNAWLTGIQEFSDKTILWKEPTHNDRDVFSKLPDLWAQLALQLLLHKRMSLEKLSRCLEWEDEQIQSVVDVMLRVQLLAKRGNSVYLVNPAIEFLLIRHFKEIEWL